jgi:hypothetical protein
MKTTTQIDVRPSNRMNFCNWQDHPAFVASIKRGALILGVGFGNTEEEAVAAAKSDAGLCG